MRYEIKILSSKRPLPTIIFPDKRYELVSSFFLAEGRNFGAEILAALRKVLQRESEREIFAGNVFSLEIALPLTKVFDDMEDRECEILTEDLAELAEAYWRECQKTIA